MDFGPQIIVKFGDHHKISKDEIYIYIWERDMLIDNADKFWEYDENNSASKQLRDK